VRWPVDLAAPSWLRMPQYLFLDTAALPFRSISIAADLRCHETDETKGAQWSTVAVICDFQMALRSQRLQRMGAG